MKTWEIDLNHLHKCVSVNICCLTDRLTDKCKHKVYWYFFWMDQRSEVAGFDSTSWIQFYCLAWDHNLFSFYLYMLILFLNALKNFVSDIMIILTSNNSYGYLLKLLQISVCVCVWMTFISYSGAEKMYIQAKDWQAEWNPGRQSSSSLIPEFISWYNLYLEYRYGEGRRKTNIIDVVWLMQVHDGQFLSIKYQ